MDFFARQGAAFKNDLNRSLGALLGIAQGMVCDSHLSDREIQFLDEWLTKNESIAMSWPGDVVYARVRAVLADGVVTEEERQHLSETLQQLVGGTLEHLAEPSHVSELVPVDSSDVAFLGSSFCLTGEFIFAPRKKCEEAIELRGGVVSKSVTKKLSYVVIGSLGSQEWKHGSFGTKVEQAVALKRGGAPLRIIHEDHWTNALSKCAVETRS